MRLIVFNLLAVSLFFASAQDYPTRPNAYNSDSLRHGEWITFYDSLGAELNREATNISHYCLMEILNGKPLGKVECFYQNGIRSWSGRMVTIDPEIKQGRAISYHKNGGIWTKAFYENDTIEGPYKSFHDNGVLDSEGIMKKGEKVGNWSFFYDNGNLVGSIAHKEGKEHGYIEIQNADGTLNSKGSFENGLQHGYWEVFYPSGILANKGRYNKGLKQGEWVFYHENGKANEIANYELDTLDGAYYRYFQNGQLQTKGQYRAGKGIGKFEYYFENGQLSGSGMLTEDLYQGPWKFYYENGVLEQEGNYLDDKEHGAWSYYYDNGQFNRTANYQAGELNGTVTYYWKNGQFNAKGDYINNEKHGRWEYYFENGVKQGYETFDNGILHGPAMRASPENLPQNMGEYENGEQVGPWKFYHENGVLSSTGTYSKGERNGDFIFYYNNSNKKNEGNYVAGNRNGPWIFYHSNGSPSAIGEYKEGNSIGRWKYYRQNGSLRDEGEEFADERLGEWLFYNEKGQLRSKGGFENGLLHGPHFYYDSLGNLEKQTVYFEGVNQTFTNLYDSMDNLSRKGQIEKAFLTLDKAESAFYETYEKKSLKKSDLYELYAVVHKRSGEFKKAEKFYGKSLSNTLKFKKDTSYWYTSTLDDLAILYSEQRKYDKAYETYMKVIEKVKARKGGILTDEYAEAVRYMAISLMDLDRYQEALQLLNDDMMVREGVPNQEKNMAALFFNIINGLYPDPSNKLDSLITRSIRFHEENDLREYWTYPSNFYYKALIHRDRDELDSAYHLFGKCIAANKAISDTVSVEYVNSLIHLGNHHYNKLEYSKSGPFYRRAEIIAENPVLKNLWIYRNAIKALSNQYWVEDDYPNTLKYNQLLVELAKQANSPSEEGQGYSGVALAYENMGPKFLREARANHQKAIEILSKIEEFNVHYLNANLHLANHLASSNQRGEADEILTRMQNYVTSQPSINRFYYYRILNDRAYNFYNLYAYDSAEYYSQKIIKDLKSDPGKSLQQYIESYRLLGDIMSDYNKDEEASAFYFQALNESDKYLGKNHEFYYYALIELAASFANQSNPTSSIKYYQQAIDLIKKIRGEERTLGDRISLAEQHTNLRQYDQAMQQLSFVQNFLQQNDQVESTTYIWCLRKIGEVFEEQEDLTTAESYILDALEVGEKIYSVDSRDYATLIRRVGQFYLRHEEYERAFQYVAPALEIVERTLGDHVVLYAWYAETMSQTLYGLDDFAAAINLQEKAANIYLTQIGPEQDYMDAMYSLGSILADAGQFENSIAAIEKSREAVVKKYGRYSFAYTVDTKQIARTLLIWKKSKEALEKLTEVKNLYDSIGVPTSKYPELYNFLGWAHLDLDNFDQAKNYYQRAIRLADSLWTKSSGASQVYRNNLAFYFLENGEYEEAERLWLEVEDQFNTTDLSSVSWLDNMAMLYTSWGKYEKAASYWERIREQLLTKIKGDFPLLSESGKAAFWDAYKADFMIFNTYAIKSYQQGNRKALDQMYENQLQTKSLLLNSTTKERKRILNSGNRGLIETYHRYVELKEQLVKYYGYEKERLESENIDIASLEKQAENLEKALSLNSSEIEKSRERNPTWRSVQRSLLADEAAIEIIRVQHFDRALQDSILYAVLILTPQTSTGPILELLPNGNFLEERAIKAYRTSMKFKVEDKRSYEVFWQPIDQHLEGIKKVYLSADGVFHQLNLATLMRDDNTFVGDGYELNQVSSTRTIAEIKRRNRKNENYTAYIFGNPKFDLSHTLIESDVKDRGLKNRSYTRATALDDFSFSELPGTKVETETVNDVLSNKNWTTNLFLEEKALEEELKRVSNPGILHIATHGFFLDQPEDGEVNIQLGVQASASRRNALLRSGLLMTGATQTAKGQQTADIENGIFTAYEAMSLDLSSTELVVLSACETGLGEIKNGEGVFGLQRAFQIAGAKSILMSLWKVDDAATQLLMTSFYKAWLAGASETQALREAQSIVRESYPHPNYWGAFVLVSG